MNVSIPELSKLEKDFVIEKHTMGWRHKKIANALAKKGLSKCAWPCDYA